MVSRLCPVRDRVRQSAFGEIARIPVLRCPITERRAELVRGGNASLVAAFGLLIA
jgi:hypothetical protein